MKYIFEVYKDKKKQFRWRLKSQNGRIIADSAESYTRKSNCIKAMESVIKVNFENSKVVYK